MIIKILSFFMAGAAGGSFSACMSGRMASGEDWKRGRSRCLRCGHVLEPYELIPVFSFLLLRGRCRSCGGKIPLQLFLTEVVCGTAFIMLYLCRGAADIILVRDMVLAVLLCGISLHDLETYLIPDGLQAAAVLSWLFFTACSENRAALMVEGAAGACLISMTVGVTAWIMKRILKKEAIGTGDLLLYFVSGLHTGPLKGILLVLFSCIAGLAASAAAGSRRIPFAPCISAACILVLAAGDTILKTFLF